MNFIVRLIQTMFIIILVELGIAGILGAFKLIMLLV